jgi:hypothetical protein
VQLRSFILCHSFLWSISYPFLPRLVESMLVTYGLAPRRCIIISATFRSTISQSEYKLEQVFYCMSKCEHDLQQSLSVHYQSTRRPHSDVLSDQSAFLIAVGTASVGMDSLTDRFISEPSPIVWHQRSHLRAQSSWSGITLQIRSRRSDE